MGRKPPQLLVARQVAVPAAAAQASRWLAAACWMSWLCPAGSLGPAQHGLSCDGGSGESCTGGTTFKCPKHTTSSPQYCIVKEADAVTVCEGLPGCKFISKCLTGGGCAGWNAANPDSVQLGAGIIDPANQDWVTCTKAPPSHALALVFVALLMAGVYVGLGVGLWAPKAVDLGAACW